MYGTPPIGNYIKKKNITKYTSTVGLSWYIANYVDEYMKEDIKDLLEIGPLNVVDAKDAGGTTDIYYYTTACMWHTQNNEVLNNAGRSKCSKCYRDGNTRYNKNI